MAPYAPRIDDDPQDSSGDTWLIDGGSKYRLMKDHDPMDGSPAWALLEFDGKEWGIIEQEWELSELMSIIDSAARETSAPGLPSQGTRGMQTPQERLYDLHGKGANMSPEEGLEYKTLSDQHKQQNGRLPGYMASWVRKNCKFAQMLPSTPPMPENLGSPPMDPKQLADEAWMYFSEEEQYQHDRMMIHGRRTDKWFEADKQALINAEQTGNAQELQRLRDKYKMMDEEARKRPQGPPQ